MPYPGTQNNPTGINNYSGPTGETEPAYGTIEREQILTRSAPTGSPNPASVPKRAQRKGSGQGKQQLPGPRSTPSPMVGVAETQQQQFWQALLLEPDASPLVKEYAMKALGQ